MTIDFPVWACMLCVRGRKDSFTETTVAEEVYCSAHGRRTHRTGSDGQKRQGGGLVGWGGAGSVSDQTVRRPLKKKDIRPHLQKRYVIPPEADAEFVACMEDVLDVYERPYDPNCPVVNMDEQPVQLVQEVR